jgi:lantibiotic modifying enzyme
MTSDELKCKTEEKLQEIADILYYSLDKFENNGVLIGNAGLALFMYYYSRYTNDSKYADMGKQALEEAVNMINNGYLHHTFCSGISGLAWTCEHLVKHEFIESEEISFLKDVVPYLLSKMNTDFNNGNYDFLHGGLGIGYYFINSISIDKTLSNKGNKILFSHLKNSSIKSKDDCKWASILNDTKQKGYNLSLSHGMSSIAICLAKLFARYHHIYELKNYLQGTVNYIIRQQFSEPDMSYFPTLSLENNTSKYSRLGWCYGDLGIAQALLISAKMLNNTQLADFAIKVFLHSSNRRDLKVNFVIDAGLCHGSAGIAHIFNRLYQTTKNAVFEESSKYWMQQTLALYQQGGLAGFKKWNGTNKGWENSYDLLDGIIGIGLSMISHLNSNLMEWDECLLLN